MPSTWPPAMANRNISIAGPRDRGVLLLPKKSAGWLPIKAAAPQTTQNAGLVLPAWRWLSSLRRCRIAGYFQE